MGTPDRTIRVPACPFFLQWDPDGMTVSEMRNITLPELASTLGNYPSINDLVVDRTGLTGRFDMRIESYAVSRLRWPGIFEVFTQRFWRAWRIPQVLKSQQKTTRRQANPFRGRRRPMVRGSIAAAPGAACTPAQEISMTLRPGLAVLVALGL